MFLSEWCEFPSAPFAGKDTWRQLASRFCWNRARPWHASELVSFLVGLRTSTPRYIITIHSSENIKLYKSPLFWAHREQNRNKMAHFGKTSPPSNSMKCQTVIQLLHAKTEMQREINGRSVAALRSARASKRVNRPITEHVRLYCKTNKQTTCPWTRTCKMLNTVRIESLLYQTTVTSHSLRFAKLTKLRKTIPDCVSWLRVHSSVQYTTTLWPRSWKFKV